MKKDFSHLLQEAVTFVRKKGIKYAIDSATAEEKEYFKILYNEEGTANKSLILDIAYSFQKTA